MGHMITTSEAAAILGLEGSTVRRLCQTGKLPARRTGHTWLISRADLEDFRRIERGPYWFRKARALDKTHANALE